MSGSTTAPSPAPTPSPDQPDTTLMETVSIGSEQIRIWAVNTVLNYRSILMPLGQPGTDAIIAAAAKLEDYVSNGAAPPAGGQ